MSYQLTLKEFRDAIFDLIQESVGHSRIYPARTNFIKPKEDYITYRVANVNPYESAGYLPDTESEFNISYLVYEIIVDIQAIDPTQNALSSSAQATCSRIRHSLDIKELHYKHLDLNNIGYLRSSSISDVSAVMDGEQWEQRAAFTCIFSVIIKQSDLVAEPNIETVLVTENLELPDEVLVVQTDVIVSP